MIMKRLLYLVLALLFLAAAASFAFAEGDPLAGDVTQDGVVDGRDVIRLMKKLNGENVDVNLPASDVTGDATVSIEDINTLMEAAAEKPETELAKPVEREIKVVYLPGVEPPPDVRKITVEIYDRNREGIDPTDNVWTDYIKKGMLEKYNIEVEFVSVDRWTETEGIAQKLASDDAPDICYTYGANTVLDFAAADGIVDLAPLLEANKDKLGNLIAQLGGEENLYYDRDPLSGKVWMLEGARADTAGTATFIRKDWLDKLGLPVPTTEAEFHDALVAFRDNAALLLGSEADKMIPYSTSTDIGWRNKLLTTSKVADDVDDATLFVYGYDDRLLLYPGYKEGVRVLNQWYNEGLLWQDFAYYAGDDGMEDEYLKAGYVGAFQNNWDYPYRMGEDSINANLKRQAGEDAEFIAVDCFKDDAGVTRKFLSSAIGSDRKIFMPATNDEPEASLLYLDFISDPETIRYLQTGKEGVNYLLTDDGAYQMLNAEGEWAKPSGNNLDYTITANGLQLGDATEATIALSYDGQPAEAIIAAHRIAKSNARVAKHYNVGTIEAETDVGATLYEIRNELLVKAVVAGTQDFDKVYDSEMEKYLVSGGQEVINERIGKLKTLYGIDYVN